MALMSYDVELHRSHGDMYKAVLLIQSIREDIVPFVGCRAFLNHGGGQECVMADEECVDPPRVKRGPCESSSGSRIKNNCAQVARAGNVVAGPYLSRESIWDYHTDRSYRETVKVRSLSTFVVLHSPAHTK